MVRFFVRLAAPVFLAAIGLSGCVGNNAPGLSATEDFRFGPDSSEGLVIVGLRSEDSTSEPGLFGHTLGWRVVWSRFDSETGRFVEPFEDLIGRRDNCPLLRFNAFGCNVDHTVVEYQAIIANPGAYALREVVWNALHHSIYASNSKSLISDYSLPTLLQKQAIPRFEVGSGEVVYIGDYTFDADETPVHLRAIDRNDKALEQQRGKIPKVKGDIVYRGSQVLAKLSEVRKREVKEQSWNSYMNYLFYKRLLSD